MSRRVLPNAASAAARKCSVYAPREGKRARLVARPRERCCGGAIAIVIGPTPPGHRREVPRDLRARPRPRRRRPCPSTRLMPTSTTVAPGLHHLARHHRRAADRRDDDIGLADDRREVARAAVADRHRRVLREQEERHRLADDVRAPDDDRPRALRAATSYSRRISMIPAGVAATKVGVALKQVAGVERDGSRPRP